MKPGERPIDVSVDAREFHRVMNMAKAFDKKLYSGLRRDLRKVGTDAAESSRAEVRKAPMREVTRTVSEGRFHKRTRSGLEESTRRRRSRRHALRAAIAQGIKVQISNSPSARRVGVFVVSKGSDPASKVLKRRWDQPKGWRHPVFPDRKSHATNGRGPVSMGDPATSVTRWKASVRYSPQRSKTRWRRRRPRLRSPNSIAKETA